MLTLEAPGRQDPPQDQLLGPGPASSPESEPERAGFTKPHTQTDSAEPTRTPQPLQALQTALVRPDAALGAVSLLR